MRLLTALATRRALGWLVLWLIILGTSVAPVPILAAEPFTSTTKGRLVLSCDGVKISEHVVETEATARAINYALEHGGKASCELDPPRKLIVIELPVVPSVPAPPPALAAPATITATPTSPTTITVAWSAVASAQSYAVERCTGATCTDLTPLVCTTAVTVDHPLAPQVTGKYRVRASRTPACAGDYSPYTPIAQARTPAAPTASMTIIWTPPTHYTDGTALTDLAGYRIHYGPAADTLVNVVQVPNPVLSRYVLDNLAPGVWYFAMRAYTSAGQVSAPSNVSSKVVM